jgi:hypothetical protein
MTPAERFVNSQDLGPKAAVVPRYGFDVALVVFLVVVFLVVVNLFVVVGFVVCLVVRFVVVRFVVVIFVVVGLLVVVRLVIAGSCWTVCEQSLSSVPSSQSFIPSHLCS